MSWKPNIRKNGVYVLKIPDTAIKYKKARDVLNGRKVKVLDRVNSFRGHGVYQVKLLSNIGLEKVSKLKMWGPYLCCSCERPYGCKCGGY